MSYTVTGAAVLRMGQYFLHVHEEGEPPSGLTGRVSLSRKPDHDFVSLGKLALKNQGGPGFMYVEGVNELFNRVMVDVQRVLQGHHPEEDNNSESVFPQVGVPDGWTGTATQPEPTIEFGG